MKTRTLIAAFALIAPMLAAAQTTSTPRIDQRQANQERGSTRVPPPAA